MILEINSLITIAFAKAGTEISPNFLIVHRKSGLEILLVLMNLTCPYLPRI